MSERGVSVFAPAKLNLFLHVGEKRRAGFHDLESLVAFAETGDRLEFARDKIANCVAKFQLLRAQMQIVH